MTTLKLPKPLQALAALAVALFITAAPTDAHAVNVLQVYMDGATYNDTTDTWDLDADGPSTDVTVLVQIGPNETLRDVTLVVAYDSSNTDAVVTVNDGAIAASGSGTGKLFDTWAPHGIYGDDTSYITFNLGEFSHDDSENPTTVCDTTDANGCGDGVARTYSVTISGISGSVHLDAYGTDSSGARKDSSNSHDSEITTGGSVPELSGSGIAPALALLGGSALLMTNRRRRSC